MTIHSDHPFVPPEDERDPLRRFRGRLASPVTVWATGTGRTRAGLTVSSMLVADGEPARALALVDEDSVFADAVLEDRQVAVSILGWDHRGLADAFAGTAPAPGGAFRLASWTQTDWGPVVDGAAGWLGARLADGPPEHKGWALLLEGRVEHVAIGDEDVAPLMHLRGRYRQA